MLSHYSINQVVLIEFAFVFEGAILSSPLCKSSQDIKTSKMNRRSPPDVSYCILYAWEHKEDYFMFCVVVAPSSNEAVGLFKSIKAWSRATLPDV